MPWFLIAFFFGAISTQSSPQDWRLLGLENEPITVITVDWSNPEVIYAGSGSNFSAGTVGGIFKSSDGGAAWDTLVRGVTVQDIDIHPTDANIIYATLGINGLTVAGIIKSLDAGETWFGASSGLSLSWEEGPLRLVIDPQYPNTLYTGTAGFFGGAPYKSTDGGSSWFRIDPDTNWVWIEDGPGDSVLVDPLEGGITSIAIDRLDTRHLYFATEGYILETWDGGKTWNTTGWNDWESFIYDIEIDPSQTERIYVGTSHSGVLRSVNGGRSWTSMNQNLTGGVSVPKVQFYLHEETSDVYIIAAWENGTGIYFLDSNQRWRKIGVDDRPVHTITIFDHDIYAGRFGENLGGIYTLDLLTSIENTKDPLPKDFSLNVFPNPTRSTIKIAYQLQQPTPVRIEIFDILGRRQELLLNDLRSPGEHTQAVNLNSLPTGVYFLRMTASGWIMSKKVILLK